jgi:hypothetical protein
MADRRDHQCPGQLRGRIHDTAIERVGRVPVGYDNAVFGRRLHVQIRQRHADDGDEFEIGQALEKAARQAHPLADRAENIERLQGRRRFVL